MLAAIMATSPLAEHTDPRPADVRHSRADIWAAERALAHASMVDFEDGLTCTVAWFTSRRGD